MKPKSLIILQTLIATLLCQNIFAQFGITSITTTSSNLPTSDTIFNRKGAGVKSITTGLEDRWDSSGTNFKLVFNAGTEDNTSVSSINITDFGVAYRLPFSVIAKVKRVANTEVASVGNHFPFFVAANEAPASSQAIGVISLNGPEVNSIETALVSNNINTGYNNIFQNNSLNVHYTNIERIDYIFPNGFIPAAGADLRKIGFTIFDACETGNPFKAGGIKSINNANEVSSYVTPILSVAASSFGNKLLSYSRDFVIFQKDPIFNNAESRPSIKFNQNMRGVFISLKKLGFQDGEKVYGFSLFADDILESASESYLLNYQGFPTNSNSGQMLDLVNSIGLYSFNQSVLASPTVLSATLQNSKVLLQWNATSFADVDKVFLQKASGNMVYNNVSEVATNQSSFIDESLSTDVSYYRLKIIMKSGEIKYSNIQMVHSKISSTQIFPTVANDLLYVSSNNIISNKPVSISIYNLDGKLVQSYTKMGSATMNFEVSSLQKGMYIISVMQNNEVIIRQKFIKS
jgi:hypothetical protein